MTAGVFVLCWSILLSPICCSSLAWKQDQERFHTYTHWPLINKSDQSPFPHIHTVPMKTKTIQTRTRSTVQSRAQPHLWSQQIRPGNPDSDPSKQPFGMSKWVFFLYTWSDDFSLVAPSQNTRRLVPSAVLPSFLWGWIGKCYCANLLSNLSRPHERPHWRWELIPMTVFAKLKCNGKTATRWVMTNQFALSYFFPIILLII